MKDSKVECIQQKVSLLKRQFLQVDAGLFGQALGGPEIAAIVNLGKNRGRPRFINNSSSEGQVCGFFCPKEINNFLRLSHNKG
jgi:hypothetical protein